MKIEAVKKFITGVFSSLRGDRIRYRCPLYVDVYNIKLFKRAEIP